MDRGQSFYCHNLHSRTYLKILRKLKLRNENKKMDKFHLLIACRPWRIREHFFRTLDLMRKIRGFVTGHKYIYELGCALQIQSTR